MQFAGSHILSVDQFERADIERVFEVADRMEHLLLTIRQTKSCFAT